MIDRVRRTSLAAASIASLLAIGVTSGCEDEAPDSELENEVEQVGQDLEEAAQSTGEALETLGQETGEALEEGAQETGQALEDAGQDLQDAEDVDPVDEAPVE